MSANTNVTVAAVFNSKEQADRALAELRQAGFDAAEMGLVPGHDRTSPECRSDTGVTYESGMAVGGMVGASMGGLAAGLPGLLAGGLAGGLLGGLIDLGIPEDAACFYRDEHQAGRSVVVVRSTNPDEAAALLRTHGAKELHVGASSESRL